MSMCRILVVLVAVCACSSSATAQMAPKYKGKPLGYWVERLQKAETDEEQYEAAEAIKAFGPDGAPAATVLVAMLEDRCADYRVMIRDVLVAIGPGNKAALPQLMKLLKEKPEGERKEVLAVIRSMGIEAKEAIPLLTKVLDDHRLFYETIEALAAMGSEAREALPAVKRAILKVKAIEDGDPADYLYWSGAAIPFLHKFGPDAIPTLLEFLDSDDVGFKSYGAFELGELGPAAKEAVPQLRAAMKHDDAALRRDSATALWKIERSLDGVPVLTELLKDEHRFICEEAAKALGEIGAGAKGSLPALRDAAARVKFDYELRRAIRRIERGK